MPVDDSIVVTVNSGPPETFVSELTRRILLFFVALQIGQPRITGIEAVRRMPVIFDRWRNILVGNRRPRIHDQTSADNGNTDDQSGEQSSTLKTNFAPFALLSEPSDFFG